MNLLNKAVKHKTYGVGTVAYQDEKYVVVRFEDRTTKFPYPDVFSQFLQAENEAIQEAILIELAEKKAHIEAKNSAEYEGQRAVTRAEKEEHEKNLFPFSPKKRATQKSERSTGKRETFFVFQGGSFEYECSGGYIWAPLADKRGYALHHWDRLLDVSPGDVIFYGRAGYIQAVSTAISTCYECIKPEDHKSEGHEWDREGRRVDCEYIPLKRPIKTADFAHDIIRFSQEEYSPFNKHGRGNLGYLYPLNRELARIFLKAAVSFNPYLGEVDYIEELLQENSDD